MEYLKELRTKKRDSQQAVADYLEITRQAYSNYENGNRQPDNETLLKLAEYFNISVDELLRGPKKTPAPKSGHASPGGIWIPVLGSVPPGIPIEAVEDILDWEEIPASMCSGGREYFALQVQGDSMWPDYLTGDVVIIRKTPCCESGEDCVVYINGYDATLKQVKLGEDGSLSIIPRNPNYPPKTYTAEEVHDLPVSIAGVVVELRRKVGRG
ncbi:LexA family protein [Lawsonibacter sp. JLR.KK007]|jgi:repressor LexA|uniref:LexA family protein n=1 Tax=Lawsonibacter sp. JLR.KK007 TaxID=3114293 RepID=UPI002FEE9578